MADFVLGDKQTITGAVAFTDERGNAVPASAIDPGSLTVTFADPTQFNVVIAPDQTSFTVAAVGTLETGDQGTVNATVNGVPLPNPFVFAFDVVAGPPVAVTVTFGTPS